MNYIPIIHMYVTSIVKLWFRISILAQNRFGDHQNIIQRRENIDTKFVNNYAVYMAKNNHRTKNI